MTVREMIRQLVMHPMDSQVVDTYGSPIMYMVTLWDKDNAVRLEPKSEMDIVAELELFFEHMENFNVDDRDAVYELQEKGYTLDDIEEYAPDYIEWAKQYWS